MRGVAPAAGRREAKVITSIEIKNLRGIREGRLDDLTPLTILVGANGCGKSTVLEALLIGGSPNPGEPIGRAVLARRGLPDPVRWLFWRAESGIHAQITVCSGTEATSTRELSWTGTGSAGTIACEFKLPHAIVRILVVEFDGVGGFDVQDHELGFLGKVPGVPEVKLVDLRHGDELGELPDVYSAAVGQRGEAALGLLAPVVPDFVDVRILTHSMVPVLHIVKKDHSVPVALAGDGMRELVRLVYALDAVPEGTVLVEEPEAHKHPAAMRQCVTAIVAAVRRGVQVVLATHSLEFIELLLAEARDLLEQAAVFGLALRDGELIHSRHPGDDARFALVEIGMDLR